MFPLPFAIWGNRLGNLSADGEVLAFTNLREIDTCLHNNCYNVAAVPALHSAGC